MRVIANHYPNWRELKIHESSPGGRGVSKKLSSEAPGFSYSHFFEGVPRGGVHPARKERCEDLERLTFDDASFDLVITQDVMEHVFDPDRVFREINRVLRPGGAHIFTVPIVRKGEHTKRRARRESNGEITHICEPQYHGNPVDPDGSLVTLDWGYDIACRILTACGAPSVIFSIDDLAYGIRAEYIDVVLTYKA